MTTTAPTRAAIRAMYVGLGLTIVATIVPYVDRGTGDLLAEHIRAGYPTYTQARIESAATIYVVYLTVLGAVGTASWVTMIRAVRAGRPWARTASSAVFAAGVLIAVTNLLIRDTSGETGLPPLLGVAGVVPCLAGLAAVTKLWRGP